MLRESTGKKSIASEPMSLIADCLVSLAWLDTPGLLRLDMKTVGRPHTIIGYFIKRKYLLIEGSWADPVFESALARLITPDVNLNMWYLLYFYIFKIHFSRFCTWGSRFWVTFSVLVIGEMKSPNMQPRPEQMKAFRTFISSCWNMGCNVMAKI